MYIKHTDQSSIMDEINRRIWTPKWPLVGFDWQKFLRKGHFLDLRNGPSKKWPCMKNF